ncbi:hypothetical protein [Altererythrobacter sp. MTPC7]|uniref:hypothetical protein n=1 Tax=Altererythrobacter sp. MTPC7 TaxID=3056567 RepID=UPI0036F1E007
MTKTTKMLQTNAKAIAQPMCGFAVDHAALSSAALLAGLGVVQITAPSYVVDLTGLQTNVLGNCIAALWVAVGSLLAFSMATGNRATTNFAATAMFFAGLASFTVAMIERPDIIHFLVHGAIMFLGFTTCEIASLTRKDELKRAVTRVKTAVPHVKIKKQNGEFHA